MEKPQLIVTLGKIPFQLTIKHASCVILLLKLYFLNIQRDMVFLGSALITLTLILDCLNFLLFFVCGLLRRSVTVAHKNENF